MLTEKLKWIAVAVVTPSVILIAAGTALIAGSRPGPRGNDPARNVVAPADEAQKSAEKKARVAEEEDAKLEARANSLESDKVEAELLEMETQAIQKFLQQMIQRLDIPE